jgi:hypothetical protein
VSLVTKCVTGDFLQLTFNDVGRGGVGGVKKCFLSLRQTALLSAKGKNWPTADSINCPLPHRLEKSSSRPPATLKKVKTGAQRRVKKAPPLLIVSPSALAPFWLFWGCRSGATAEGNKKQNLTSILVKAGTRTMANVWSGSSSRTSSLEVQGATGFVHRLGFKLGFASFVYFEYFCFSVCPDW